MGAQLLLSGLEPTSLLSLAEAFFFNSRARFVSSDGNRGWFDSLPKGSFLSLSPENMVRNDGHGRFASSNFEKRGSQRSKVGAQCGSEGNTQIVAT